MPDSVTSSPATVPEAAPETAPESVVVETTGGQVRGMRAGGISAFKGILYGVASGERRFRAPVPPPPWHGVREALAWGDQCPQVIRPISPLYDSWTLHDRYSEDCLRLNVWTPGKGTDDGRRPVMVYFHGGGFNFLSSSWTGLDGTRLARRGDVVVVTMNHRLGVLGHLFLDGIGGPDFAGSGNAGMLDLVLALQWVRDNIAAFGGDPGNVTIFGESGGGAKVSVAMAMPAMQGLFHRAVVQSGSHLRARTPDEGTADARAVMAALGLGARDVDGLLAVTADRLVGAMKTVLEAPGSTANFSPVVDGTVLPREPWEPDAPAVSAGVPLLVGTTATETTWLIGFRNPAMFVLNRAALPEALRPWLSGADPALVIDAFRAIDPDASPSDLFFAITTNTRVRRQAWAQAERKAGQGAAPVWLWELAWRTPVDGGMWRSPHAMDLPLVFDNVADSASFVGTGPRPQALADRMADAWVAFARNGDPGHPGLPAWPAFEPGRRATMVFDDECRVEEDRRGDERRALAGLPILRVNR